MIKHFASSLAIAASLTLIGAASAGSIVFDFQHGATNPSKTGVNTNYASGSQFLATNGIDKVTAGGYVSSLNNTLSVLTTASNPTQDLFSKFTAGDPTETGLGIASDPSGQNEITSTSTVKLDFTALHTKIGDALLNFTMSSVQTGEGFDIFNSNKVLIDQVVSSPSDQIYTYNTTLTATNEIFYFTA